MRRLKRVVIREELVELTGHWMQALILNQFLFWLDHMRTVDRYLQEEAQRAGQGEEPDLTEGWIYKTAAELADDLMVKSSRQTMRRHLGELVEKGWLHERTNPKYEWDRTLQYRPDLTKIAADLAALGYPLEGYSHLSPQCPPDNIAKSKLDVRASTVDEHYHRDSNRGDTTKKEERAAKAAVSGKVDTKHPAIQAWRRATKRYPRRSQYEFVAAGLGEEVDEDLLQRIAALWVAHDFNPLNVAGQIEWYQAAAAADDPASWEPYPAGKIGYGALVENAWEKVMEAVRQIGRTGRPEFEDKRTAEVVEVIGWRAICEMSEFDGKRRFAEEWERVGPPAKGENKQKVDKSVSAILGAFSG